MSLGPGLRWGDVYNALDSYGVSLIGGRIPQVGVGGLILGGLSSPLMLGANANRALTGGFFHFSGEYGLAADNAKNFEVSVCLRPTLLFANPRRRSSWQTAPLQMQVQTRTVTSSGLSKVVVPTSVRPNFSQLVAWMRS